MAVSLNSFEDVVKNAIESYIKQAIDDQIELAKERVEQEIRKETANIVMSASELYSFESTGLELVIKVHNYKRSTEELNEKSKTIR